MADQENVKVYAFYVAEVQHHIKLCAFYRAQEHNKIGACYKYRADAQGHMKRVYCTGQMLEQFSICEFYKADTQEHARMGAFYVGRACRTTQN